MQISYRVVENKNHNRILRLWRYIYS